MEREIEKYDVVTGKNARDLQKRITESMSKGWVPQGGISHDRMGYPVQAVVMYKSPNQN